MPDVSLVVGVDLSLDGDYRFRAQNGKITVLRSEIITGPSPDEQEHAECFMSKDMVMVVPQCEGDGWYRCPECAFYEEPEEAEDEDAFRRNRI